MRRHLLLTALRRRQRLLSLRPALPLRASLERHRTLAVALGLTALAADDRPRQPLATRQPLWSWSPHLLAARQPIDETPPLVAAPLPSDGKQAPAAAWPPEPLAPAEAAPAPATEEDQGWEAEAADEEALAAPSRPDERQQQETAPLTTLPSERLASRAHVIEQGIPHTAYDTIALPASESDLARVSQSLPASPGSISEVAAAPELSNEAAQLFRPHQDEAERSPQSWFRRLVEQARREQEQAMARPGPAPAPDSPGFPERGPGGASEQPLPARTRADRVSRERSSTPALRQVSPLLAPGGGPTASTGAGVSAAAARSPEPPALAARRFLKPLVGIDLAEVALYRDAQAAHATEALAAAALSDADTVELAPQQEQTTPEGLGLLAHELTHIMRRRRPRFLPPIMRSLPASSPDMEQHAEAATHLDEEQLAITVERRVRRQAQTAFAVTAPMALSEPTEPPMSEPAASMTAPASPVASNGGQTEERERGIWGKLPAPWEPLPAWLTAPASSNGPAADESMPGASLSSAPRAPLSPAIMPSQPLGTSATESAALAEHSGVSRAGVERSLATPVGGQGEGQSATPGARPPEPDLDALARQVYTLLKRRLSVEQRRLLS
ncbi:eCIS core domain-containing protein [Thermogemmatispora carboxidivorans]|uniref:eCIS core domain-containing protein n=1 Tax=Thermogemmatispora carboxidivorans TaxID=1382306 RepID=UPI00069CA42E|nr:DUF4157 domain-containing protein [Thermogemmatispora carboxidivorans]